MLPMKACAISTAESQMTMQTESAPRLRQHVSLTHCIVWNVNDAKGTVVRSSSESLTTSSVTAFCVHHQLEGRRGREMSPACTYLPDLLSPSGLEKLSGRSNVLVTCFAVSLRRRIDTTASQASHSVFFR